MSVYSDSDYEQAMEAILKLTGEPATLKEARDRLKKIADIAEGGKIPYEDPDEGEEE